MLSDSEDDDSPQRSLRNRTDRQLHPFQMDKMEHNHFRKGKKVTESILEKELHASRKRLEHHGGQRKKKQRSTSSRADPSSSPSPSTLEEPDLSTTTIRTWFKEIDAYISLALNVTSVDELLDSIERAWQFQLGERAIKYCVVTFPWSASNSKLMMMRNNDTSTGFEVMLREIRQAPTWAQGECAIEIEVFV